MDNFNTRLQMMFVQMIPFLMAIVFHEVAHAYIARRFGDDTAKNMGRLTLNPIPHIDPIGTLLFPMVNMLTGMSLLFGWAKPVPINYNSLKPYRKGLFLVAFAGPMANVLLALACSLLFVALSIFVPQTFYFYEPLRNMSYVGISINFALCVFNLLPLPPLDGSRMVESFLSTEATKNFEKIGSYSFIILLLLLWSGGLNVLSVPIGYLTNISIALWLKVFSGFLH